jgi:hypothetical protein
MQLHNFGQLYAITYNYIILNNYIQLCMVTHNYAKLLVFFLYITFKLVSL